MQPIQRLANFLYPSRELYVRLLEQSLCSAKSELIRERATTDKYSQCLRDQLERALTERDATKRELARATDQLIAYAGRSPISDESNIASTPAEIIDTLHASLFGEDEGNNIFPRELKLDEPNEEVVQ